MQQTNTNSYLEFMQQRHKQTQKQHVAPGILQCTTVTYVIYDLGTKLFEGNQLLLR